MKKTISMILVAFSVFFCMALTACSPEDNSELITLEEYNKIETGMSYDEVKNIIGSDGEVSSETGKEGDDIHIVIYSWKGKGSTGANALITFSNGEVETKAQAGLE